MGESRRVLVLAAVCLTLATVAGAATITVNSSADSSGAGDGQVTLREAVAAANADGLTDLGDVGSGADTIVFDALLTGATIELATAGDATFGPTALAITSDVTIDGGNAPLLTISRSVAVSRLRLFRVDAAARLRLERITLANGAALGFDGGATHRGGTGGGSAGLGGAILNQGALEIVETTLHSNRAAGGNGGPESAIFDTYPRGGSGGGGLAGAGGAPSGGGGIDNGGAGGAAGGATGGNGGDSSCTAGGTGGFGGGGGGGGGCANNPACNGGAGGFGGGGGGGGGRQTGTTPGSGGAGGFGGGNGGNGTGSSAITAPGGGGGGGAGMGGAVFNHGGTLAITNSTFSANSAEGGAGGRGNGSSGQGLGGGVFNRNGSVTVLASTFTGNAGGGVYNLGDAAHAALDVKGSILANSSGADLTGTTNGGGTQLSGGSDNLIESQSGYSGTTASTSDPQLAPLVGNGGPTPTHLQALGSPAIDASTLATPTADQRGVARPQGAAHDIGAVELVFNQPPVAVCADVTVSADANCVATIDAAAVDGGSYDPDGDPITFSLASAGPHPLGATSVVLTVTDDGGLSTSCTATVTVVDTTPPAISCPADVVLECPADLSPAATGFATATDNCSTPSITWSDVTVDGCGGTVTITRTWVATDLAGNASSCTQTIRTVDTTPPAITPGAENSACLWPPNGKYVFIENVTAGVTITDACDSAPAVATVSCVSSQCDDAPCAAHPGENGDGKTFNDCVYDPGLDRLAVRAERAGTDPAGRTYLLLMTAVDGCGNASEPVIVFTVHVPHDQNPGQSCLKP